MGQDVGKSPHLRKSYTNRTSHLCFSGFVLTVQLLRIAFLASIFPLSAQQKIVEFINQTLEVTTRSSERVPASPTISKLLFFSLFTAQNL
jgi:hypothetical protein